jgi:hypothetical protein
MADPLSILGAVVAIANIIDTTGKAIHSLNKLRSRWREADLTFLSLASQLTALRAALVKIQEWSEDQFDYQLVMDLNVAVPCCRLLGDKVEMLVEELNLSTDQPLTFSEKVKFVFGNQGIEGVQKLIEQQTNALGLLLHAYSL